jgi:hypothetical protein
VDLPDRKRGFAANAKPAQIIYAGIATRSSSSISSATGANVLSGLVDSVMLRRLP